MRHLRILAALAVVVSGAASARPFTDPRAERSDTIDQSAAVEPMDLAAVIAGMIFGYRSFCHAAGFIPNRKTLARVVARGLSTTPS